MKKAFIKVSAFIMSLSLCSFPAFAEETTMITDGDTICKIINVFKAENNIPEKYTFTPFYNSASGNLYVGFETNELRLKYAPLLAALYEEYHIDRTHILYANPTEGESVEPSPVPQYLLGDVNEDSTVAVDDAMAALSAYAAKVAEQPTNLNEAQTYAADPNGDGELTIEDAIYILKYYTANTVAESGKSWIDIVVFDA